jgi:hypothetical protein
MERQWLIRTKNNHILGPVSKEKIIELINNGSLKGEDEICSGNGYWIFVREQALIERFLTTTELQCFNPMSEAKDVLTLNMAPQSIMHEKTDKTQDIVIDPPGFLSRDKKKIKKDDEIDLSVLKQPWLTEKKLSFLMYVGFIILVIVVYYRHVIIKSLREISSISLIPEVHAQEQLKKKTYLIP